MRQVRPGQVFRDLDPRRPGLVVVDSVAPPVALVFRYRRIGAGWRGGPKLSRVRLERLNDPGRFKFVRQQATDRDTR